MTDIDLAFQRESYPPEVFSYQHHMQRWGVSKAQAKKFVRKFKEERVVRSRTHQVAINAFDAPRPFGGGTWLSIKRVDRSVIDSREELAAILRVVLPGHGGFELLPAPRRLVDTANQYHVWAFPAERLRALVELPLGPPQTHPRGFEVRRLMAVQEDDSRFMVALDCAGQGDWRALYELKEQRFPGCEGFVYFHHEPEHPYHGQLFCLDDPALMLPFGFGQRAVSGPDRAQTFGAVQRELVHEPEAAPAERSA